MNTPRATRNLMACATLLAGCDAKAGSDYEGEPLLSFAGHVVVENAGAPPDLVPVLAFRNDDYVLHIADVSVRGSFPANFQVDVLTPPPADAFLGASEPLVAGEPRVAVGSVAVPRFPGTCASLRLQLELARAALSHISASTHEGWRRTAHPESPSSTSERASRPTFSDPGSSAWMLGSRVTSPACRAAARPLRNAT